MNQRSFRLIELPAAVEWKLFGFLSAAFALSVPFPASINSSVSILMLIVWILFIPKTFNRFADVIILSAIFWIGVLGMLYTADVEEGWFRLQQKVLLWIMPMIYLTANVDQARLVREALSVFVSGITAAALYCLAAGVGHAVQNQDSSYLFSHALAKNIDVYPYILAVCSLLCQVILLEARPNEERMPRWLSRGPAHRALIGLHVVFLFLLSVQQVLLIWGLFIGVTIIRRVKQKFHRILLIGAFMATTTLAVYWVRPLNQKFNALFLGQSTIRLDQDSPVLEDWNGRSLRKAIWTCAWDIVKEHPWLGVGTGDAQEALQRSYANRKFYLAALYNRYNAHNQYIQVLISHGTIGVVLWLGSLVWALYRFRHNTLFVIALGCTCLAMLTESMLETNKGNLLLAVVTSIFLLYSERSPRKLEQKP